MMLKAPNWRFGTVNENQRQMIEEQLPMANTWQRLSLKVQSTGMYGPEFASLLEIVKNYQATQQRPVSMPLFPLFAPYSFVFDTAFQMRCATANPVRSALR